MFQQEVRNNFFNQSSGVSRSALMTLEDISMDYGTTKALSSINLTIQAGEVLFLTGPSGAGKTTLLKLMGKNIAPSSGQVNYHVDSKSHFIGKVYQDLRLIPGHTCEKTLDQAYDRSIYKSKKLFLSDRNELCRILGISDRLNLKIKEANGGLKQKVAIIRALLTKPSILLLDEPTSSLDLSNAKKLYELLSFLNVKRGITVVWATHNKDLVKGFSGRIVHLEKGKLIHSGHACFI
ncbi:MAG: cell division ATP-binding protein FtsE [Bacteriovoracaceae bacterium]